MNPLTGGLSELVRQADRKRETSHQYEADGPSRIDRKSTRLNSSHTVISYAVFCLKKKKPQIIRVLLKQASNTDTTSNNSVTAVVHHLIDVVKAQFYMFNTTTKCHATLSERLTER